MASKLHRVLELPTMQPIIINNGISARPKDLIIILETNVNNR